MVTHCTISAETGTTHEVMTTERVTEGLHQTGKGYVSSTMDSLLLNNWFPNFATFSFTHWVPSYPNPIFFALKLECWKWWIWKFYFRYVLHGKLTPVQPRQGWMACLVGRNWIPSALSGGHACVYWFPPLNQFEGWHYILIVWVM